MGVSLVYYRGGVVAGGVAPCPGGFPSLYALQLQVLHVITARDSHLYTFIACGHNQSEKRITSSTSH